MNGTLRLSYNLQFFAQEGPGGEKTEEPTGKRREDARKKGQVAKSQEVYNAVSLFAIFLLLRIYGQTFGKNFLEVFRRVYGSMADMARPVGGTASANDFSKLLIAIILRVIITLLPVLLLSFVVAFVVNLVQVKWKVSFEPMKPKFSKLNPLSGFKRFFSKQKLVDLAKAVLKIVLVSAVVYSFMRDRIGFVLLMNEFSIESAVTLVSSTLVNLGIRIASVYIVIAALDYIYTRWKHHEDLKMTKQEVKDEMKDAEGNPEIKGKIRQKMREISRARMMQAVPEADVVITNPTHYAVALKYDTDIADAPVILAKGQDYVAMKIKEEARAAGVEIVENKPLARMLYANVEIGEKVPPELYQAVAEVLAFVYNIKKQAG
ncbi:MAG: flagellar biosynthesis protein FlhB [Lachnospiraceae bacterium]|nr:flagellar biosynthesis protein FlhB [Lachnospiraceae bacterium]